MKGIHEVTMEWYRAEREARQEYKDTPGGQVQYRNAYGEWPKREIARKKLAELYAWMDKHIGEAPLS